MFIIITILFNLIQLINIVMGVWFKQESPRTKIPMQHILEYETN